MSANEELLEITKRMLDAMYSNDSTVHRQHSAGDISSFEWYLAPYRIDGLDFHLALIEGGGNKKPSRQDMLTPRVQVYGDTGVVTYTLLKTEILEDGGAICQTVNEARVFSKIEGTWKMVHLHKSPT
jgi:hypothetical protein